MVLVKPANVVLFVINAALCLIDELDVNIGADLIDSFLSGVISHPDIIAAVLAFIWVAQ